MKSEGDPNEGAADSNKKENGYSETQDSHYNPTDPLLHSPRAKKVVFAEIQEEVKQEKKQFIPPEPTKSS